MRGEDVTWGDIGQTLVCDKMAIQSCMAICATCYDIPDNGSCTHHAETAESRPRS